MKNKESKQMNVGLIYHYFPVKNWKCLCLGEIAVPKLPLTNHTWPCALGFGQFCEQLYDFSPTRPRVWTFL